MSRLTSEDFCLRKKTSYTLGMLGLVIHEFLVYLLSGKSFDYY